MAVMVDTDPVMAVTAALVDTAADTAVDTVVTVVTAAAMVGAVTVYLVCRSLVN